LRWMCERCLDSMAKFTMNEILVKVMEENRELNIENRNMAYRIGKLEKENEIVRGRMAEMVRVTTVETAEEMCVVPATPTPISPIPLDHMITITNKKVEQTQSPAKNRNVVILSPVDNSKRMDIIKEMKKNVNAADLNIKIQGVETTAKGNVIVTCGNTASQNKLRDAIKSKVPNVKTTVSDEKKFRLHTVVYGENAFDLPEDGTLIENEFIHSNNINTLGGNFYLKLVERNFSNYHQSVQLVFECDIDTKEYLLKSKGGKVIINWEVKQIKPHIRVLHCFKCQGYGHKGAECKGDLTCRNCSMRHHTNDCYTEYNKCTNCVKNNAKFNTNLDYRHIAHDAHKCNVYNKIWEQQMKKFD
jgi:hypothetical protein